MTPDPNHSDTMQQTCKGLSKIFSLLEEDFEKIIKMVMMGFSDKEIKTIMAKSKKDFKKHKQKEIRKYDEKYRSKKFDRKK